MTTVTPVGQNIQNFKVTGVIAVLSPNPNFQVPGFIEPHLSGAIATPPVTSITFRSEFYKIEIVIFKNLRVT